MVSKALESSKYMFLCISSYSILVIILPINSSAAYSVECLGRNNGILMVKEKFGVF